MNYKKLPGPQMLLLDPFLRACDMTPMLFAMSGSSQVRNARMVSLYPISGLLFFSLSFFCPLTRYVIYIRGDYTSRGQVLCSAPVEDFWQHVETWVQSFDTRSYYSIQRHPHHSPLYRKQATFSLLS